MTELADESVQLMVTSPPYFNAPFDYKGFFRDYDEFLGLMRDCASEVFRVLEDGRIACVNCDDMLVDGEKYPVVADALGRNSIGYEIKLDCPIWDSYTMSGAIVNNVS